MPISYQQAMGFLVSQTAHLEREAYKVEHPDIQYPKLVYVDTSAPEWANTVEFISTDQAGKADWFHGQASDMPRADVNRAKGVQRVHMAGIGYGYDLSELGQASMLGLNLTSDKAEAAVRAYEEFMDNLVLRGDPDKGIQGLMDYAGIAADEVPADGTGSSTDWRTKTADQIIRDINDQIVGQWVSSLTVELADTVALPVEAMAILATKRVPDTNEPVLSYLTKNNVYTHQTGQPLKIVAIRGLETAGEGGTGRMIVYKNDRRVVKLHLPMPHRFLPVWQTHSTSFEVPGIFRTGGVEVRRPGAFRYADGIIVPAST